MGALSECALDCHDAYGRVVARIRLAGSITREGGLAAILSDEATGAVLLRERETYDYQIESPAGAPLVLMQDPGVQQDRWDASRGKIRLGDYCGMLVLRLSAASR